jgi:hypothetical protein
MTLTLTLCLVLDLALLAAVIYRMERQVERAQIAMDAAIRQRDEANDALRRMVEERAHAQIRAAAVASFVERINSLGGIARAN